MVTVSFVRNSTSPSCTYLWRATLASCFARLDRETPNTGSQFFWPPSLPFLCSMPLSGKTHPAQVTRLLHSTTAEGSVPHAASTTSKEIPHLILFWDQEYLLQEGTACSGSLSGVLMLWSSRDAEGPQDCSPPPPLPWGWKRGGREGCETGRRAARPRPSFQSMWYQRTDLSGALTNTPSPGALPVPSQLAKTEGFTPTKITQRLWWSKLLITFNS